MEGPRQHGGALGSGGKGDSSGAPARVQAQAQPKTKTKALMGQSCVSGNAD